MLIALASTGAGGCIPQQTTGKLVLQISSQNSLFDQNVFLRYITFVVHVDGTTSVSDCPIIHNCAQFAGYLLADLVGKGGHTFPVEISFQSMTDCFVKQN